MAEQVTVTGAQEAISRLRGLAPALDKATGPASRQIVTEELPRVRARAARSDRQSALAARSVQVRGEALVGGAGSGPAAAVFFGAEFGGRRRKTTRQFRQFRGQRGYWFFEQLRDDEDRITDELVEAADAVIKREMG